MARPSPKEITFAKVLAETGDAQKAYFSAYPDSAPKARYPSSVASHIANKPQVKALVEEITRGIRTQMVFMAPEALQRLEDLAANAMSEKVRLEANKEILYGAGLKPPEQIQLESVGIFGAAEISDIVALARANAEDIIDVEATSLDEGGNA